jgi:hypothetical protein
MKGIKMIVAPALVNAGWRATLAHAQSEFDWHACPFAFAAIKMVATRPKSKISADDFTGIRNEQARLHLREALRRTQQEQTKSGSLVATSRSETFLRQFSVS